MRALFVDANDTLAAVTEKLLRIQDLPVGINRNPSIKPDDLPRIGQLIDTARRENRQPTPVEQAMIRGLRRQTYALFETELVRRGDPGADTEATRSAGELTDENQAERE